MDITQIHLKCMLYEHYTNTFKMYVIWTLNKYIYNVYYMDGYYTNTFIVY